MPNKKLKPKSPKRTYDKPLTLSPLSFEEAVKVMLDTPPMTKVCHMPNVIWLKQPKLTDGL
jgi:hypothetical protein